MNFCPACGGSLKQGAKFCAACGTAVQTSAANASPRQLSKQPASARPSGLNWAIWGGILGLIAVIAGALIAAKFLGWFDGTTGPEPAPAAASAIQQGPVSFADWASGYRDNFMSTSETLYITGTARLRDYPTSDGSTVMATLGPGDPAIGRWVVGRDPTTRWLKLESGGYVWEGNVGGSQTIHPTGMAGLFTGRPWNDFRSRFSSEGTYGDYGEGPSVCEVYDSLDGTISVMFEQNRSTSFVTDNASLSTQKGVRVGSTVPELQTAYGDKLQQEANPYAGTDYFVWETPENGLRFYVGDSGRVERIWSGTRSIKYVEGCL